MSYLSKLRKKVHYEVDVPRCANCKNYKVGHFAQENKPAKWQQLCKAHDFIVKHHAICDSWLSKAGEVLE